MEGSDLLIHRTESTGTQTVPVLCGNLRKGSLVVLNDVSCRVIKITFAKGVKHGAFEAKIVAKTVFTGATVKNGVPSDKRMMTPSIERERGTKWLTWTRKAISPFLRRMALRIWACKSRKARVCMWERTTDQWCQRACKAAQTMITINRTIGTPITSGSASLGTFGWAQGSGAKASSFCAAHRASWLLFT